LIVFPLAPGPRAVATSETAAALSLRLLLAETAAGPTTRATYAFDPPSRKNVSSASYRMLYETRGPYLSW
jgi:hypothetical protein